MSRVFELDCRPLPRTPALRRFLAIPRGASLEGHYMSESDNETGERTGT